MIEKSLLALLLLVTLSVENTVAQEPLVPRPSPMASIGMRYKDAYMKIVYSRPHKNGREIFGKLVPYGQVWRTGANEATEIILTKDMLFNNILVRAGTYSLFTIPQPDKWTIILNSELGQWGAYNYNQKADVLRFDVPVVIENVVFEPFTMEFIQRNEMADLLIRWDKVRISIPLKFLN